MPHRSYPVVTAKALRFVWQKGDGSPLVRPFGERITEILLTQPEPNRWVRRSPPLDDVTPQLRVIGFRYSESDPWTLQAMDLTAKARKSVALCRRIKLRQNCVVEADIAISNPNKDEIILGGVLTATLGPSIYGPLISRSCKTGCHRRHEDEEHQLLRPPSGHETLDRLYQLGCNPSRRSSCTYELKHCGERHGQPLFRRASRLLLAVALCKHPKLLFPYGATRHSDTQRTLIDVASNQLPLVRVVGTQRLTTTLAADRMVTPDTGRRRGTAIPMGRRNFGRVD